MVSYSKLRFDTVLQPVSGKAVPVYKGEVLRIKLVEGELCVDFNCFNLHDYKEHMSTGNMRQAHGFRVKKGATIISASPRNNPMMVILEMSETCITDIVGARCNAALFEMTLGFDLHTNCQDTIAECIGEYGLTPDDVHDSLNLWFPTSWNDAGEYFISPIRNPGRLGDYVDLLALMDVLAVPVIGGGGDVTRSSNYWLKHLGIQVFEPSEETQKLTQDYLQKYGGLKNQRTAEDFRIKEIRTERELKPIPGYESHFINFPLKIQEVAIELTEEDYMSIQHLKELGLGEDDEDAVRSAVMEWYIKNRAKGAPSKPLIK